MATNALNSVIDAVLTMFGAASSLTGIGLFDGVEISGDPYDEAISVGHDGGQSGDVTAADWENEYTAVGAKKMYERGQLHNALWVNSGGLQNKSARARAQEILSAIDTIIRSDPSLMGTCLVAGLGRQNLRYIETDKGLGIEIIFDINYHART